MVVAAEFAAATTIVLASRLRIPISTTHTLVGGVLGVGVARGIGSLNLRAIREIVTSWVVTFTCRGWNVDCLFPDHKSCFR